MQKYFSSRPTARIAAAATSVALLLGALPQASAQTKLTHYSDVRAGDWFEASAEALLNMGALERSEPQLRPNDPGLRAEMAKLLVLVNDMDLIRPSFSNFDDVRTWAWYYAYVETAANAGWLKGDQDCYRNTRPCTARPLSSVNRAEAAALLVRAFESNRTGDAPVFPDNNIEQWYYEPIQIAADHCILVGDDVTGRVRPGSTMNRAEMVVMFHRASQNLEYGVDCSRTQPQPEEATIESIVALDANTIRITFDMAVNEARVEDESRYDVESIDNGRSINILSATRINDRTVELGLQSDLDNGIFFRVTATNLLTAQGVLFSDSGLVRFVSDIDATPEISDVEVRAGSRIRLTFTADLDADRSEDESRYTVRATASGTIAVRSAIQVDDRTVELTLGQTLANQTSYTVEVSGLRSSAGTVFSDSATFLNDTGNVSFRVTLLGANETPPIVTSASGTGSFTLTANGLVYDITVKDLTGTFVAAHFHRGLAGVAGPVVRAIAFTGNRATGTWVLAADERQDLLAGRLYVNVHTDVYPNGEIRAQLIP